MVEKKEYKVAEIQSSLIEFEGGDEVEFIGGENSKLSEEELSEESEKELSLIDQDWQALAETDLHIKGDAEPFEEITDEKGLFKGPSLKKGRHIKLSKPSEEEWIEEIEAEEYPEKPGPLPCLEFRDRSEGGKGPLQRANSRQDLVEHLQLMLLELGYDLGSSGSLEDGVDGVFGDKMEQAVKAFQQENKDYDGEQLVGDGIVGEKTADALNRRLVGIWYDKYETPSELTPGRKFIATTREYAVRAGIEV